LDHRADSSRNLIADITLNFINSSFIFGELFVALRSRDRRWARAHDDARSSSSDRKM